MMKEEKEKINKSEKLSRKLEMEMNREHNYE